jgi:hypothetical protein
MTIDPNQALAELRTLVYIASTIVDGGEVGDWHACMSALIETFEGLDEWLSKGGFPPDSWKPQPLKGV